MRLPRILAPLAAAAAAAGLAGALALLVPSVLPAAPSKSQRLFERALLADARTTAAVKELLRGGGFVAPEIVYADLTADGRSDAVVLVESGGAAGVVALYVLSTHGRAADAELRAIYRSQRLYRASAEVAGDELVVRAPRYGEGDDLCCPARVRERRYSFSARAGVLRLRSSRELRDMDAAARAPSA